MTASRFGRKASPGDLLCVLRTLVGADRGPPVALAAAELQAAAATPVP